MQPSHLIRIAVTGLISLLLFIQSSAWTYHAPLNPGCITSGEQWVLIGTLPATITATTAGDGTCSGNYQYQWQVSTDNIYFTDIPGATGQNLSFTTSPTQSAWYQRKVTCGSEVAYTGTVKVNMVTTLYYNVAISGSFTRNNCGGNGVGTTVTYTIPANTYSSPISVADANAKAQAALNASGQAYANANATCTWYNVARSQTFTRNNCLRNLIGTDVVYTVPANTYSSNVSQEDANQQATNDINANGQAYANANGLCKLPQPTPDVTLVLQSDLPTAGAAVMVEFLQNGQVVKSGTIPASFGSSVTTLLVSGTYDLRFTVNMSGQSQPINYKRQPTGSVWVGAGSTTLISSVLFSPGSYTIYSTRDLPE
jgi:hypothetical protein